MIGQSKLLNIIKNIKNENFPRTSLLVGDYGCGKHTLAKIISTKLNIEIIDLKELDSINLEKIYLSPIPYIYLIDGNSLNLKEQNILLKTIEEPLNNAYIIIIVNNQISLLNTLLSRCTIFKFEIYKKEDLINFIPEKYKENLHITKIYNTPGKLLDLNNIDFNDYYNFSLNIFNNISKASLANTLTLVDKFNYKDEYNKYNISLILNILIYISSHSFIKEFKLPHMLFYDITNEYIQRFNNNIYDKKQLMLSYITSIWEAFKYNGSN